MFSLRSQIAILCHPATFVPFRCLCESGQRPAGLCSDLRHQLAVSSQGRKVVQVQRGSISSIATPVRRNIRIKAKAVALVGNAIPFRLERSGQRLKVIVREPFGPSVASNFDLKCLERAEVVAKQEKIRL